MQTRSAWIVGLVLACVATAGPVSGASPQAVSEVVGEDARTAQSVAERVHPYFLRKVREILAPPTEGTVPVQEEIVGELAGLGAEAVPTLLAFLTGEVMLFEADQPAELGWAGSDWSSREDIVILDTLALLPSKRVLDEVRRMVGDNADYGVRMVAMRVLARVTSAGAFDVWHHVVSGIEPVMLMRAGDGGPIEEALTSILARDRSAYRALVRSVPELEPPLWPTVARAVGNAGQEAGLEVLERLAGRTPETDAAVLAEVAVIAEGLYSVSPDRCYSWIRPMLHADDQRTRSRAIATLVDLGDADSIPNFVDMLDDPARRVQRGARQALEQLSGRKLGQEPDAWDQWYTLQLRWLETEAVVLREKIDSHDPAEVVAAVGALSQRRVFREELVEMLANALGRKEAEIVAATCIALGQLGSKRAAPYLLDALRDPEDLVRDSAWRALKLLTDEDLPREYEVWARRLRG